MNMNIALVDELLRRLEAGDLALKACREIAKMELEGGNERD